MARARRPAAASVDFADFDEARRWFGGQPREVAVSLSVRTAMRILPQVARVLDRSDFGAITLSVFRALTIARTISERPNHTKRLGAAADAADAANAANAAKGDAMEIESAGNAKARARRTIDITGAALWPEAQPEVLAATWRNLKLLLQNRQENWEVWIAWYEDRLAGRPTLGEAFDLAVAELPDELWKQGPAAVNTRIAELIAEHTPAESIPTQGLGPQMRLGDDIKIELVPPSEIDDDGNDLGRIRSLLPQVRRTADRLASHLGSTNAYPELGEDLAEYRAALGSAGEVVAWGTLFGAGIMLENAAAAAKRKIDDRLWPALEDTAQAALNSLLSLHGPLVLAVRECRALADDADRMQQTREEQTALQIDAVVLANRLQSSPDIIADDAARIVSQAASVIGAGVHPERGTVWGLATIKHLATILVPAGVLGAAEATIVHVAGGGEMAAGAGAAAVVAGHLVIGDRDRIRAAARALGDPLATMAWDQVQLAHAQITERFRLLTPFRDFVTANHEPLRRIAANSTQMRWMLSYIDFILRANPKS